MIVEIILSVSAVFGTGIYYWDDLGFLVNEIKRRFSFNSFGLYDFKEKLHIKRDPLEAVSKLLGGTLGLEARIWSHGFIFVSLISAIIVLLILNGRIEIKLLVLISVFSSLVPYLLLLCRLQSLRIAASKEGEILLTELLDNYKINYYNMQQAIEVTAFTIKEAPGSKRLLFNLSKGLNTANSSDDIRRLLDDFEYGLGTSWASVMADNMYFALVSGIRVTAAMEDLVQTLSQARKVSEYAKRENNEGLLILKYLVPSCYVLTFFAATKYFGLSPEEYFKYQFMTSAGLGWFVLSLMAYGSGLFLGVLLSKTKLDL